MLGKPRGSRWKLRLAQSATQEERCIAAVRKYIDRTYPSPDPHRVIKIIQGHGRHRVPLALLLEGSPNGSAEAGALAAINRAVSPLDGDYGDPHPLFSSAYYSYENPDVVAAGIAPWVHYQRYGWSEGRTPHPLLKPMWIARWLPDSPSNSVVDSVLRDRSLWLTETSPYVEARQFVIQKDAESDALPLEQILVSPDRARWLSFKLMLIDAGSVDRAAARRAAAILLLGHNTNAQTTSRLHEWEPSGTGEVVRSTDYTVISGYLLGKSGRCFEILGDSLLSPDTSMVRLADGFLSSQRGRHYFGDRLIFV